MAIACVIQAFIGLFFFLNPPVKEFVYSFVKINELAEESLMQSAGFRLHGLGANFFSAGVTNCAILVLCAIFVLSNKRLFIICFIIIAILGSCMSRTTMVGGAIALPVLLYNIGTVSKTKLIVTLALIVAAFSLILRYAANSNEDSIYALYAFGAELLINLEEKGSVMSSGVEALDYASHMPESFWTYIIGDGLYADPKNPTTAYYMGVDQGYLRMLYYVGLIGLTFRLLSYLSFFKKICIMNKSKEFYFLFAVYLIAMYKGDTDIFQFIVPLYFIPLISFRK